MIYKYTEHIFFNKKAKEEENYLSPLMCSESGGNCWGEAGGRGGKPLVQSGGSLTVRGLQYDHIALLLFAYAHYRNLKINICQIFSYE